MGAQSSGNAVSLAGGNRLDQFLAAQSQDLGGSPSGTIVGHVLDPGAETPQQPAPPQALHASRTRVHAHPGFQIVPAHWTVLLRN